MSTTTRWHDWHRAYDDPDSWLSRRLVVVERELAIALDASAPGAIRLLSLCSGDGRDVLDVLASHARQDDVSCMLVDLDAGLLERARTRARALGLRDLTAIEADAGRPSNYAEATPADVLLACGIFGNVTDDDVRATIEGLPGLLAPGAHVLWTRHRRPPDLTVAIRGWFEATGFEERCFEPIAGSFGAVGHHVWPRATGTALP